MKPVEQAKSLIGVFGRYYREKVGEKYLPTWTRDIKLFKDLLEVYPRERLERMLETYFETPQKIYSVVFFRARVAELVQVTPKEDKPKKLVNPDRERF